MHECADEESAGGREIPLLGAITWRMSARSCRVDQQRCEALHPPEDRDVSHSSSILYEHEHRAASDAR